MKDEKNLLVRIIENLQENWNWEDNGKYDKATKIHNKGIEIERIIFKNDFGTELGRIESLPQGEITERRVRNFLKDFIEKQDWENGQENMAVNIIIVHKKGLEREEIKISKDEFENTLPSHVGSF